MKNRQGRIVYLLAALASGIAPTLVQAQNMPPDHPSITVDGKTWNPRTILARNQGKDTDKPGGDMVTIFPPHKIIGNVYYVGTRTLSSFLITTPEGNILIDSMYERTVPDMRKSVEQLGFKFSDIKLVLNNHAHSDHVEGDAMVKELTGAKVVVMAEDVPLIQKVMPGGKPHPVDRIIHDGDTVTLGDTTLVAHWTPGHSPGATTWTMQAREGGKTYNVVFYTSIRPPGKITPEVEALFDRTVPLLRSIPCDVPLGDHTEAFMIQEKYAKMKAGGPNPYVDPMGCNVETDVEDSMLHAIVEEQNQVAHSSN